MTFPSLSKYRKRRQDKYQRQYSRLTAMRSAKARKRQAMIDSGEWEQEPHFQRYYRFELGIRDKQNGETHFVDLKSVRHAATAIGLILKHYQ